MWLWVGIYPGISNIERELNMTILALIYPGNLIKPIIYTAIHLLAASAWAQTQIGADIDGELAYDYSGWCVSMPDSQTIAIGAVNNNGSGPDAGHVRIFQLIGGAWVQKGADIDGEAGGDSFGWSVCMPDANTLAVGAVGNDGNGNSAGHVRIYSWNGGLWVKKGSDIDGESANDWSGYSVSMPDGNTVAIGARSNSGNGTDAGHVRVFEWSGGAWVQKGVDLDGEAADDWSGFSVSMPDASTVAIGAPFNDGMGGASGGHVRIYEWNGSAWVQKGADIDGESSFDQSGWYVSMPDAQTVGIGARFNNGYGQNAGHVRIFAWNGNAWIQKGADIDGEAADDQSGVCLSMPDANTVAIGALGNDGNGNNAGHARIFSWDGSAWAQLGIDIDGETTEDNFGWTISMPDAQTVAIGTYLNDGNGISAGHARVYDLTMVGISKNPFEHSISVSPNPASGPFTLALDRPIKDGAFLVHDIFGREVHAGRLGNSSRMQLPIHGPVGVYFLQIRSGGIVVSQTKLLKVGFEGQ
jgi:hypothetical protein